MSSVLGTFNRTGMANLSAQSMQGFTKPGTSGFEPSTQGANVGTVAA